MASVLNLSNLDGWTGFRISGEQAGDYSGTSVSSAGDINGDGFADLLVGSFRNDAGGTSSGSAYLVFGRAGGFPASIKLSALNGANGFQMSGLTVGAYAGEAVSSAGDLNGDGFDDIIIGAPRTQSTAVQSGSAYVVFGKAGGFPADLDLSQLNGTNGFVIKGSSIADLLGSSVAAAGDVNGDGLDDIVVGAPLTDVNGTNAGSSYVIFGTTAGFSSVVLPSSLNGSNGFRIHGEFLTGGSGFRASSAGDMNGDGFDDLLIAAPYAAASDIESGAAYVVFGKADGFGANLNLSNLNGSNGFQITGEAAGDRMGLSVSSIGDVNGDGFDDIVLGAPLADPNGDVSGAAYVVFGKDGGFGANLALSTLNGANGFQLSGVAAGAYGGVSVSGAGDVNGDGFDDVIVGAPGASLGAGSSGSSYVLYGRAGGFSANVSLSGLTGALGFRIDGATSGDRSGSSVGAAGDVNRDGYDDIIIGAIFADPTGLTSGASYVIYGRPTSAVDRTGIASGETLTGSDLADRLAGAGGNDTVLGNAGSDTLAGGSGSDTIRGGSGRDVLTGGQGLDSLRGGLGDDSYVVDRQGEAVEQSGQGLDTVRSSVSYSLGGNLENLVLVGTANLSGTGNGLANKLTGNAGANTLSGGAGKDLLVGGQGLDVLKGGKGDDTFLVNAAGEAREQAGEGVDTVRSSLGYTLGANLENLVLLGTAGTSGTGNGQANALTGNGGANRLDGRGGSDVLTGFGGNDRFVFSTSPSAGNVDRITDMNEAGNDTILLENGVFVALGGAGALSADAFRSNATGLASDGSDRIILETDTGEIYYDSNGSASGGTYLLLARVDAGITLTALDFLVI